MGRRETMERDNTNKLDYLIEKLEEGIEWVD